MNACGYNHDEIAYEGRKCPMCETIARMEELEDELSNVKVELGSLKRDCKSVEEAIALLESELTACGISVIKVKSDSGEDGSAVYLARNGSAPACVAASGLAGWMVGMEPEQSIAAAKLLNADCSWLTPQH